MFVYACVRAFVPACGRCNVGPIRGLEIKSWAWKGRYCASASKFCMYLVQSFLRQCSGEKSIFFNNATNELLFGRKHCFYDLNIKMVHFCTFIMRLLWKLGKIAAILDSRRRKKRSQFWIFCYQIFNISKKLQYLQTYQRDFWNFEKKSIF